MKIIVTGSAGMLGLDVMSEFDRFDHQIIGHDLDSLDITDHDAVEREIKKIGPDAVIHCAAFTNVDGCETEKRKAFSINARGAGNIAAACHASGSKMIYISTDYVFNGEKSGPYNEYDSPDPVSVYGMSKYYGERYVEHACPRSFIVRTSWLFGSRGHNFVKAILRQASEKRKLAVVVDQWGSPTYTRDLAAFLRELAGTEYYGTYHATNEGFCTWYDFAKKIIELSNAGITQIDGVSSATIKRPAKRPANSMLYKNSILAAGLNALPRWEDALKRYFEEK